jgi:hypothetical protein
MEFAMSYTHVTKLDDGSYIVSFSHKGFTGGYTVAKGDEAELPENSGRMRTNDAHKQDRKEYVKEVKQPTAKPAKAAKELPSGTQQMSIAEIIKQLKKGVKVCTPGGTMHNLAYCEKQANKDVIRTVIIKP